MTTTPFSWLRSAGEYIFTDSKTIVKPKLVKAAAESVVDETKFRMAEMVLRLQRHEIELAELYLEGRRHIKTLTIAEAALARGGWDQMRPADYAKAAEVVAKQWGYWNERMEVAERGVYGPDFNRRGFSSVVGQYAEAGRSTYENTRLQVRKEGGAVEARRILGAADHCPSCEEWAALGWIPVDEMESEYPIGAGECRHYCRCVIVTRRDTSEFVSLEGD